MGALVSMGLVVRVEDPDGAPRFRMLDTIREFASDELAAQEEVERLRRRLAEALESLARAARPTSAEQVAWFERLDAEQHNLRAVLAWAVECRELELGVGLLERLWWWFSRSLAQEGRDWAERFVQLIDTERAPRLRARALFVAGALSWYVGEPGRGRDYLDESAAIWRDLGDPRGLATRSPGARSCGGTATSIGPSLRDIAALPLWEMHRALNERALLSARAALGVDEFDASWAQGHALPLEDAIAEALLELETALPEPMAAWAAVQS
jgi:hypothetical protein